jgi:hypothetical protein
MWERFELLYFRDATRFLKPKPKPQTANCKPNNANLNDGGGLLAVSGGHV